MPLLCLIVSYVSRLNGPCCYRRHHKLCFLSEGGRHKSGNQQISAGITSMLAPNMKEIIQWGSERSTSGCSQDPLGVLHHVLLSKFLFFISVTCGGASYWNWYFAECAMFQKYRKSGGQTGVFSTVVITREQSVPYVTSSSADQSCHCFCQQLFSD